MIWKGKSYSKGQMIPEEMYEDYIDIAYGVGCDLKETRLWKSSYQRGFACPDGNGKWYAFAYDGRNHRFLGTFPEEEVFEPEEESWEAYKERLMAEADRMPATEAIDTLRALYVDPRSKGEWTEAGLKMANDPECLRWFSDYWSYVRWNEHGNECSLSEVGFGGFVDTILRPEDFKGYLLEGDNREGRELADRLEELNRKYTKKGGRRR